MLAEKANIQPPLSVSEHEQLPVEKHLLLPKANRYHTNVFSYLTGRGIDAEIIRYCMKTGRIYESAYYHNAVFVGMDQQGKPQYAALRGINTDFIGEANGSDKNYSFSISAKETSDKVHVFESAIDLLSYATMQKLDGKEWQTEHLLSLAGVYQPAKEIEKSKVPAALTRFLKEHSDVKEIVLHLDNDCAGRFATKAIQTVVPEKYHVKDQPPTKGKDCNDMLCLRLNLRLTKREKSKNQKSSRQWER